MHVAHQVVSQGQEMKAGPCEVGALGAPYEEGCSYPLLKSADAAAEGRLRDVPGLSGPGKVLLLRQSQKILEPVQVHFDADHA
jgi:hypothetical protein